MMNGEALNWRKPRRCESGHCPEAAVDNETELIVIRSSLNPEATIILNREEWEMMVAEMRSECPFGIDGGILPI